MPTVEEITRKYIELRDRKAELAKKHQAELMPYNQAMEALESYLLNQMNELGVDSLKNPAGTPYKAIQSAVSLSDAVAFKNHVFYPAFEAINHYLCTVGYDLQRADIETMQSILQEKARWDMVDFRAGKKGILEYQEQNNTLPPGIDLSTNTVVNIRRG